MTFLDRLKVVTERVESVGGSLDTVKLVAVTKTLPVAQAQAALANGIVDLGENYAQEILTKSAIVADPLVQWHLIGNVQRNKVKKLAGIVSLWQTVDRLDLGLEIAKRAPGAAVLVQVNTTAEPQKSGCSVQAVDELLDRLIGAGLDVQGLMTVGPTDRSSDPRPSFETLRELGMKNGLSELSMGMSGDLEAAVSEGSTMIRVGTALFGPRNRAN